MLWLMYVQYPFLDYSTPLETSFISHEITLWVSLWAVDNSGLASILLHLSYPNNGRRILVNFGVASNSCRSK
jgi:hypothetical protein